MTNEPTQSDTSRTDEKWRTLDGEAGNALHQLKDFARTLERELNEQIIKKVELFLECAKRKEERDQWQSIAERLAEVCNKLSLEDKSKCKALSDYNKLTEETKK